MTPKATIRVECEQMFAFLKAGAVLVVHDFKLSAEPIIGSLDARRYAFLCGKGESGRVGRASQMGLPT